MARISKKTATKSKSAPISNTKFKVGDKAWWVTKDKECEIKEIVPLRDGGYEYDIWTLANGHKYAHFVSESDLKEMTN